MFHDSEPAPPESQKTGVELRTQTIAYVEDAIAATGLTDGWWAGANPEHVPLWDPATAWFGGRPCGTSGSTPYLRFEQNVYHAPVPDPAALVAKVGAHWRAFGYDVSTVTATMTNPGGRHDTEIRADLQNGALLGIDASDEIVVIYVYSECSTDSSLDRITGPKG